MDYIKQNTKLIGFVACGLMLIGNFLPFITAKASLLGVSASESQTLLSKDNMIIGVIAIILEAVMAFLVVKKKKKLTLIPVGIVLLFLFICKDSFSGFSYGIGSVDYGIGFYAILLGCILGAVYAFFPETITASNTGSETTNRNTKFCAHCGSKINATAEFCDKCGEKC